MYREFLAEMIRLGFTLKELAKKIGMPYSTLTTKLQGKSEFKFDECVSLKAAMNSKLPLELLFKKN